MGHKVSKFFTHVGDAVYHIGKKAVSFVGHTVDKAGHFVLHAIEHPLDTVESLGKKIIHVVLHPGKLVSMLSKMPGMLTGPFKQVYDLVVPELSKVIPGFKSLTDVINTVYKFGNSTVFKVIGKSVDAFGEEFLHIATHPLDALESATEMAEHLGDKVVQIVTHPEEALGKLTRVIVNEGKKVGKRIFHDVTHPQDALKDLKRLRSDASKLEKIGDVIEKGGSLSDIAEVALPLAEDLGPLLLA